MDNKIEPQVVSEAAIASLPAKADPGTLLALFKLVGVGPHTYLKIRTPKRANRLMENQPNFYVYASREDMRAVLHIYVDKFCDTQGI